MCATMKAKAHPIKYSSVQLLLTGQCIYIRYYANKKSKKEEKVGYCIIVPCFMFILLYLVTLINAIKAALF